MRTIFSRVIIICICLCIAPTAVACGSHVDLARPWVEYSTLIKINIEPTYGNSVFVEALDVGEYEDWLEKNQPDRVYGFPLVRKYRFQGDQEEDKNKYWGNGFDLEIFAEPGSGYEFGHWEGTYVYSRGGEVHSDDYTGRTDNPLPFTTWGLSFELTAHFTPIAGEGGPSEWETPEDPGPPPETADLPLEPEEQDETITEVPIEVLISAVSHTVVDESGCNSQVRINAEATDTTGGNEPIIIVQLYVDGEEDYVWSQDPTEHYQEEIFLGSDCSEVRVLQLIATNGSSQTKTTNKEVTIPPLSTHFTYGFIDSSNGEDCQIQLFVEYQADDLTTPDNLMTNVVVKANGEVWDNSGTLSTDHYENEFMTLVDCGETYTIEVIGADADGNTYTYRETIEIPSPEPPDEPPPPQTTLYAAMAASAQCTSSGPECSCQLSISFDGKDLTGGTYPVTKVILRVNGAVWHDSGSISQTNYHHVEQRTVNCGQTFNLELTVNNTLGQTATSTGSITTPIP